MAVKGFIEKTLKEYPNIHKYTTPTRRVKYRIRLVYREFKGKFFNLVDIREYIMTEKKLFGYTKSGIWLNIEQLDKLIPILQQARKELADGTYQRDRDKNPSGSKS